MFSSRLTVVVVCACASGIASDDASPLASRVDVQGDNSLARSLKEEELSRAVDIEIELDDNTTNETDMAPVDEIGCSGEEEKHCCRLYVEDGDTWICASKKAENGEGMDEAYCEMKKGTFCKESKVYREPVPGQSKITFSMDIDVGDATVEDLQKDETFMDSLAETMMVKLNVVRSAVKVVIKENMRRLSGALRRLSTSITVDFEIAVDEDEAATIALAVNGFTLADVQSTLKETLKEKGSPIADIVTVKQLTQAEVEVITASPTKAPTPRPRSGDSGGDPLGGGSPGAGSPGGGSSGGGSKGDFSLDGGSSDDAATAPTNATIDSTNATVPAPSQARTQTSVLVAKAAGSSSISIVALLVALVAVGSAHVA